MKKIKRTRLVKLVTIVCAAVFILGCSTTVFAAVDLVGRGTTGGVSTTASTTAASSSGSTSTSVKPETSGTSAQNTAASQSTANNNKNVVTNNATVSKVGRVETGVFEKITPFLIVIAVAFVSLTLFFHLQMNQVRYGKSEKYYKELLDFICACKP